MELIFLQIFENGFLFGFIYEFINILTVGSHSILLWKRQRFLDTFSIIDNHNMGG